MIGAVLTTLRLILRPLEPADASLLLDYVAKNRTWLDPWEPSHPESYYTMEGQWGILTQCQEDRKNDSGVLFGIFEKYAGYDRVLGRISLSGITRGIWQNGFVGYSIAGSRAGKGYMTECLKRVVVYGLNDLNLHRIQASIIPRNEASLRVAEKSRFRHEGRALRYLKIKQVWEDHEIFAITADEIDEGYEN